MKTPTIILLLVVCSVFAACGQQAVEKGTVSTYDTIYIPKDLQDCFEQIGKNVSDSMRQAFAATSEGDFTAQMHRGYGMWMRNNWGLWRGSRLSKYFKDQGINHPDDMTAIVLASYHRHITGKPINLDKQIKYYQDYWKVLEPPSKKTYPKGVRQLEFNRGFYYQTHEDRQGFIHIGTSKNSRDIWLYDFYNGWIKVQDHDVKELEQNPDYRADILIKLYKSK